MLQQIEFFQMEIIIFPNLSIDRIEWMAENALTKSIWANKNCEVYFALDRAFWTTFPKIYVGFFHKLLLFNSNACCNLYNNNSSQSNDFAVDVFFVLLSVLYGTQWPSVRCWNDVERRTLEQRSKIKMYYKLHDQRCIEKFRESKKQKKKKQNAVIITVCFVLLQNRIMYTAHAPRTQSPNNNILASLYMRKCVFVFAWKIRWQ